MTTNQETIEARGSRLATIDLWRMPDGRVEGRLLHMDPRLIETTGEDVPDRLRAVADWTLSAAGHFEEEAGRLEGGVTGE